jgi:hypothetical protein
LLELHQFEVADGALLKEWITGPVELTWSGPSFTWPLDDPQLAAYAAESAAGRWLSWTAGTALPARRSDTRAGVRHRDAAARA